MAQAIAKVKGAHTVFDTALTIDPHATVGEALAVLPRRSHQVVVVIDEAGTPLGTVSERDLSGLDRFNQVHEAMSTDLILVPDTATPRRGVREAVDSPPQGGHRRARNQADRCHDSERRRAR